MGGLNAIARSFTRLHRRIAQPFTGQWPRFVVEFAFSNGTGAHADQIDMHRASHKNTRLFRGRGRCRATSRAASFYPRIR
jgi:hypothetical protein